MEKRGRIDVRAEGKMTTYYLVSNEKVTKDDLTGRGQRTRNHDGVEVTFINEGRQEQPPPVSTSTSGSRTPITSRNRVGPDAYGKCQCAF